ncbi:hypothetical protein EVAR_52695_1 [Eumeta japonica]|uniref:Uncharacterized protein n=1 Tax=Eumeta variegata TaxID=151549 RepID=A0A4C1Y209_EUMVA|nr:hypothetical protein EVAR_52695_1 [Eumeta japonica]
MKSRESVCGRSARREREHRTKGDAPLPDGDKPAGLVSAAAAVRATPPGTRAPPRARLTMAHRGLFVNARYQIVYVWRAVSVLCVRVHRPCRNVIDTIIIGEFHLSECGRVSGQKNRFPKFGVDVYHHHPRDDKVRDRRFNLLSETRAVLGYAGVLEHTKFNTLGTQPGPLDVQNIGLWGAPAAGPPPRDNPDNNKTRTVSMSRAQRRPGWTPGETLFS